jgi:hypothetical protein
MMNDQPEITTEALDERIMAAFNHLYPYIGPDYFTIEHREDETIWVTCSSDEVPTFKADIYSDDDDFLRFYIPDEDYEAEFPDEDPYEFLMIRVKVL